MVCPVFEIEGNQRVAQIGPDATNGPTILLVWWVYQTRNAVQWDEIVERIGGEQKCFCANSQFFNIPPSTQPSLSPLAHLMVLW
jgi:hypothetical protein